MKKKMRAVTFLGKRQAAVTEIDVPPVGPGEVRVRLKGCGVCASNVPVWEGRSWFQYPYQAGAPGHEGWGTIDECGQGVTEFEPGQAAAILSFNGYAEYDTAPAKQVVALPEQLSKQPFPAEPLGCAVNVFNRCRTQGGDIAAIVGVGFLGSVLTALLSYTGHQVIAISRRMFALETARQCGAAHTIRMGEDAAEAVGEVTDLTGGRGCGLVIEAVGNQRALDLATELTAERGMLVVAGYHQDGLRQVNMQSWNWKGLDVINAHERQTQVYMDGIRRAIGLVQEGVIPLQKMLTHYYAMEEISQAMQDLQERPDGFLKGCVMYE